MYIKITNVICFMADHDWLPANKSHFSGADFAICKRCREIKVSTYGVATTWRQVWEKLKR